MREPNDDDKQRWDRFAYLATGPSERHHEPEHAQETSRDSAK